MQFIIKRIVCTTGWTCIHVHFSMQIIQLNAKMNMNACPCNCSEVFSHFSCWNNYAHCHVVKLLVVLFLYLRVSLHASLFLLVMLESLPLSWTTWYFEIINAKACVKSACRTVCGRTVRVAVPLRLPCARSVKNWTNSKWACAQWPTSKVLPIPQASRK